MSNIDDKLKSMGIILPDAPSPAANYIPFIIKKNIIYISGQIPFWNGDILYKGKVGREIDIDTGKKAARTCALNIISVLKQSINNLDMITKCIKLGVFVNSTADFENQPEIANGASDLIVEVFGELGKHTRFAVGSNSLPMNISVEIDATIKLK